MRSICATLFSNVTLALNKACLYLYSCTYSSSESLAAFFLVLFVPLDFAAGIALVSTTVPGGLKSVLFLLAVPVLGDATDAVATIGTAKHMKVKNFNWTSEMLSWEEEGGEKKSVLLILGSLNPFTSTFLSSDIPSKTKFSQ